MNEESGNVVHDSSQSGFHGEIHDVDHVTYKQKILRRGSTGALGFNLFEVAASIAECFVSDAVAGDFFRKLAGNEKSCTIAFWFEPTAIRNFNWMYAYPTDALWGKSNYRCTTIGAHSRGGQILAESPSDVNTVNSDEALLDMLNKNHFVVWRKDAVTGKYTLTVNDITSTVSGESSPETVGTGFYFPMSAGFDNYGLRGYMSDMSVFDYVLSDVQIADLYNKGTLSDI
ncbi:hypothetical protein QTA56_07555 [Acinetobacter sp. VNH17]|uniref:LamG domain-containing protein n=1 Tax=Acinetobacter thutiue TaxID=2998078 RepID=A0ABT7WN32_9GAMM|nr:hypothetical protein [Acinetobacter thutiue]MCY6411987.1 hypothetical protein [Acinetobacter thutiue]MDN0014091.1 hypothetical protein [Acinetobacter thutiue]